MSAAENSNLFICSVCGVHFSEEKQFFGHLRIHSGEVSWSCSQCSDLKFDSQSRLRVHENTCHNVIRPFKCQQCGLEFDRASQLAYHQRSVHLGEKSHICQICEKGFFRKTDLRTHLNIHLGTNVCICEVCGRKFNHVSNLIRHCRTHAGVKPYPCTVCGKRFTQISSLVRHKRIHEKTQSSADNADNVSSSTTNLLETQRIMQRRHYCKICGENFKFILLLRQHEKEHADTNNILECQHCKKTFQKSEDVKEHVCDESSWSKEVESENYLDGIEMPTSHDNNNLAFTLQNKNSDSNESMGNLQYNCLENASNEKSLETALCITSEQLEQISLEKMDDVEIRLPEERVLELVENMNSLEMPLDRVTNVNIAEILNIYNSESDEFLSNDSSKLKVKHSATDVIYVQCLSKNDSPLNNKSESKNGRTESLKLSKSSTPVEVVKELPPIDSSLLIRDSSTDQDAFVHFLPRGKDTESFEFDQEKSAMRLVQIETGQQFYELIMNSFSAAPSPKITEIEDAMINNAEKDLMMEESSMKFPQSENQEFEFFRNEQSSNMASYKNDGSFDNYAEQFLEFEQPEKLQNDVRLTSQNEEESQQFFGLEARDDESMLKNKTNENLESNALDFLICVIGNVELDSEADEMLQNPVKDKEEKAENSGVVKKAKDLKKPGTKKFECTVCNKTFSTSYNFKQHVGTHFSEQQNFHCKECGLSFAWKSTLNKHVANNHRPEGRQMFVCEICPKVYSTLSQVNEHVKRDHLKERNHVCFECGKSFFKKFDLKIHCRTHTNERPYTCRLCGKGFHHRSHIIRHKRIHSGEKPYLCDICQKSFSQKGSLKAHKQRHNPEKLDILDYNLDNDDALTLGAL